MSGYRREFVHALVDFLQAMWPEALMILGALVVVAAIYFGTMR